MSASRRCPSRFAFSALTILMLNSVTLVGSESTYISAWVAGGIAATSESPYSYAGMCDSVSGGGFITLASVVGESLSLSSHPSAVAGDACCAEDDGGSACSFTVLTEASNVRALRIEFLSAGVSEDGVGAGLIITNAEGRVVADAGMAVTPGRVVLVATSSLTFYFIGSCRQAVSLRVAVTTPITWSAAATQTTTARTTKSGGSTASLRPTISSARSVTTLSSTTASNSASSSASPSLPGGTASSVRTLTASPSATRTLSPAQTLSTSPSATATISTTLTSTQTSIVTFSASPTSSVSPTSMNTLFASSSSSPSRGGPTVSSVNTMSAFESESPMPTLPTQTPPPTPTIGSSLDSPSASASPSASGSASNSKSVTASASASNSASETGTPKSSTSPMASVSETGSPTPSASPIASRSDTGSLKSSASSMASRSRTGRPTPSISSLATRRTETHSTSTSPIVTRRTGTPQASESVVAETLSETESTSASLSAAATPTKTGDIGTASVTASVTLRGLSFSPTVSNSSRGSFSRQNPATRSSTSQPSASLTGTASETGSVSDSSAVSSSGTLSPSPYPTSTFLSLTTTASPLSSASPPTSPSHAAASASAFQSTATSSVSNSPSPPISSPTHAASASAPQPTSSPSTSIDATATITATAPRTASSLSTVTPAALPFVCAPCAVAAVSNARPEIVYMTTRPLGARPPIIAQRCGLTVTAANPGSLAVSFDSYALLDGEKFEVLNAAGTLLGTGPDAFTTWEQIVQLVFSTTSLIVDAEIAAASFEKGISPGVVVRVSLGVEVPTQTATRALTGTATGTASAPPTMTPAPCVLISLRFAAPAQSGQIWASNFTSNRTASVLAAIATSLAVPLSVVRLDSVVNQRQRRADASEASTNTAATDARLVIFTAGVTRAALFVSANEVVSKALLRYGTIEIAASATVANSITAGAFDGIGDSLGYALSELRTALVASAPGVSPSPSAEATPIYLVVGKSTDGRTEFLGFIIMAAFFGGIFLSVVIYRVLIKSSVFAHSTVVPLSERQMDAIREVIKEERGGLGSGTINNPANSPVGRGMEVAGESGRRRDSEGPMFYSWPGPGVAESTISTTATTVVVSLSPNSTTRVNWQKSISLYKSTDRASEREALSDPTGPPLQVPPASLSPAHTTLLNASVPRVRATRDALDNFLSPSDGLPRTRAPTPLRVVIAGEQVANSGVTKTASAAASAAVSAVMSAVSFVAALSSSRSAPRPTSTLGEVTPLTRVLPTTLGPTSGPGSLPPTPSANVTADAIADANSNANANAVLKADANAIAESPYVVIVADSADPPILWSSKIRRRSTNPDPALSETMTSVNSYGYVENVGVAAPARQGRVAPRSVAAPPLLQSTNSFHEGMTVSVMKTKSQPAVRANAKSNANNVTGDAGT